MINPKPLSAGAFSVILALVLILLVYAAFGRVDLIFKLGDDEICRQENVCFLSAINDPTNSIPDGFVGEGEELKFYFVDGDENVYFSDSSMRLRVKIVKTVMTNLITFKWGDASQFVIINAVKI